MCINKNYFQILGCGHSESIMHFNNNALVRSSKGILLIDAGHTVKHALYAQNLTIGDIDEIYISHVHGDHVFGLERIAYESRYIYRKRIKLIFHELMLAELWDQSLKGSLNRTGEGQAELSDYFDVVLLNSNSFCSLGNYYDIFAVKHTPSKPTFGLCLHEQIFYSSDTLPIPDVISEIKFNVGFHDVTLTEKNPVHAPLMDLVHAYPIGLRKKLYLMSYQDNWNQFEDIVNTEFGGFAVQGMRVSYE